MPGHPKDRKEAEKMATVIICVILVLICAFGVKSYVGRLSHGCCGGSSDAVKRVKPADDDISHYPYLYVMEIDGMTCKNCAARIENAFNTEENGGFFASVKLNQKKATVRAKEEVPEAELRRIVIKTGYSVVSVAREK